MLGCTCRMSKCAFVSIVFVSQTQALHTWQSCISTVSTSFSLGTLGPINVMAVVIAYGLAVVGSLVSCLIKRKVCGLNIRIYYARKYKTRTSYIRSVLKKT